MEKHNQDTSALKFLLGFFLLIISLLFVNNLLVLLLDLLHGDLFGAFLGLFPLGSLSILAFYGMKKNKRAMGLICLFSTISLCNYFQNRLLEDAVDGLWFDPIVSSLLLLIIVSFIILYLIDPRITELETRPSFAKSLLKFCSIWGLLGLGINLAIYMIRGIDNSIFLANEYLRLLVISAPLILIPSLYLIKKDSYFGMILVCAALTIVSGGIAALMMDIQQDIFNGYEMWSLGNYMSAIIFVGPSFIITIIAPINSVIDLDEDIKKRVNRGNT